MSATRIGLLGGTFDPVHFGHLDAAATALASLELDEMWFIPSADPPHRRDQPRVSPFHRFALIALAVSDLERHRVSDLELGQTGRSYTANTLQALHRQGWRPSQLFFVLGADAFAEIATWHQFPQVLDDAHFAVVARPGSSLDTAVARIPALGPRIAPSAESRSAGDATRVFLVHGRTRDVSSTRIRDRLARREPVDDLVPDRVARYIERHHLYER